jgi:hypothetical protein
MILLQLSQGLVDMEQTVTTALANLGETPAIDSIVGQILTKTQTLALLLGVCFYLLMLGFNYVKSGINKFTNPGDHFFIDLPELTRTIGLLFLIGSFPIFMGVVAQFVNVSYSMTKMSRDEYNTMINAARSINAQYALQTINPELAKAQHIVMLCNSGSNLVTPGNCKMAQDVVNEFTNSGSTPVNANKASWYDIVTKLTDAIVDGIDSLVASLFLFIIVAIKMIIFGITKIWLKILYVTGPIALAFSIIPFFRRQGEVWFGYYLNTCFVFITFNILDCIFFGFMANQIAVDQSPNLSDAGSMMSQSSTITYYLILIIAYVSAFRITSYYVGHAEAGKAVGKAVGFVADLAMIAFTSGAATSSAGNNTTKIAESMSRSAKGIKDNEE